MDDLVVVTLFRHGVTEDNRRKVYSGWTDAPLIPGYDHGMRPYSDMDGLYFSSDLTRCKQTFNKLFPKKTPILLSKLREMNFGKWEGKSYADLKDESDYRAWITDPITTTPPDGESFKHFTDRVDTACTSIIEQLEESKENRVAIVTHSGVIRSFLTTLAPEQKSFWEWNVPHEKAFELIFDSKALRRKERCTSLQVVPLTGNGDG